MFCPNCGQEITAGNNYCQNCGFDLTGAVGSRRAEYAGFWLRFVASIIDGVAVGMVAWIIFIPSIFGLADISYSGAASLFFIYIALWLALPWLYYAIMESSSRQATLGKLVLGIVVTDDSGDRVSFARATGRYFGKFLSQIIFYIGYLMIAFTDKKQGLHDILASTLVVKK